MIGGNCFCGGKKELGQHCDDNGTVVTQYLKCNQCGLVAIRADTTGRAVKRAYNENLAILRHMNMALNTAGVTDT